MTLTALWSVGTRGGAGGWSTPGKPASCPGERKRRSLTAARRGRIRCRPSCRPLHDDARRAPRAIAGLLRRLGGGRCVCHHARGSRRSGTAGRRGRRRVVSPAVPPGWPPPTAPLAGSRTPRLVDTTDQGALAGLPERRGLRRVDAWDDRRLVRPPPKRRRFRHAVVADERKEDMARRFRRGLPSHAEPSCPPRRRASGAAPTPWSTWNAGSKPRPER